MSFNTSDLLHALGTSLKKARLLIVGQDTCVELWLDTGYITRVEGCAADDINRILLQQSVNVWIRPYDLLLEPTVHIPINNLNQGSAFDSLPQPLLEEVPVKMPVEAPVKVPEYGFSEKLLEAPLPPTQFPETLYTQKIERIKPISVIAPSPVPKLKVAEVGKQTINVESQLPVTHTMLSFKLGTAESRVLGRQSDCQLIIDNLDVSRRHCELIFDGVQLEVKDLGSKNGTFLNGNFVTESKVNSYDVLNLGASNFIIVINP